VTLILFLREIVDPRSAAGRGSLTRREVSTMTHSGKVVHVALVALAAAMLAGCGVDWSGTPWSDRLACEDSGGEYGGRGFCYYESP
jgi:hypothetical protein